MTSTTPQAKPGFIPSTTSPAIIFLLRKCHLSGLFQRLRPAEASALDCSPWGGWFGVEDAAGEHRGLGLGSGTIALAGTSRPRNMALFLGSGEWLYFFSSR